jgi:uncharacterized protein (TIGR03437 family)
MRSAEYQRTNPKRQSAQSRKARSQCRIDPGGGGVDNQPARAALLYVSPSQINAQVPFELPDVSSVDLVVQSAGGNSAALNVTLLAQDPGIFSVTMSGTRFLKSRPAGRGPARLGRRPTT